MQEALEQYILQEVAFITLTLAQMLYAVGWLKIP